MKRVHRLLSAALTCVALQAGAAAAADRALLVGVNKYAHMPPTSQLNASLNDARMIEKLLIEQWGFQPSDIKTLADGEGTANGIKAAMRSWLVDGSGPGDRVFFYYSGHGYFMPDKDGDEPDGKDEVLAPHDAADYGQGLTNVVSDDDIRAILDKLTGRSVMVLADSCHSGSITRAFNPSRQTGDSTKKFPMFDVTMRGGGEGQSKSPDINVSAQEFEKLKRGGGLLRNAKPGVLAWTAAAATEIAQEDVSGGNVSTRNGVFTLAFNDGIRSKSADADGNGMVSAAELLQFLRTRAKDYCGKYACDTGMTPTLESVPTELQRNMLVWPRGGGTDPGPTPQPDPGPGPGPGPQPNPNPGPDPTDVLPPPSGAFTVSLDLLPGAAPRLGDEIKLKVTSSKPGYLVMLDVREDGKVVQLFPSTCTHPERAVRANAPLTMPDPTYGCTFTATEPGKGQVLAIVSEDNVPLEALLAANKGLEVISDPSTYLGQIAEALLGVWSGDERNRPVKWGLATARYEIKP